MIRQRLRLILIFVPIIFVLVIYGRWPYALGFSLALALAALEFGRLFQAAGRRPAVPLMAAAAGGLALARHALGFDASPAILSAFLLLALTWHVVDYERGAITSGTDFALTVAGGLYVGWLGAYLISLRALAWGMWWVILVLGTVWMADICAYLFGSRFGRRRMTVRLSPKKTWEGYAAGVTAGVLGGASLAWALAVVGGPDSPVTPSKGLVLGLALAVLTPLGDLGISMIKRELSVKDTGSSLPGHGGFLDRMDSWLWAAVIGYFTITILE